MKIYFPYVEYSDDDLDNSIVYAMDEIHSMIRKREFEGIETWGMTLINLEKEKEIRNAGKH